MIGVVDVDPALVPIVRPLAAHLPSVRVTIHEPALDAPLDAAAVRMGASDGPAAVIAAVRTMYKRVGLDPTKTRPSSEALLRRVRKGQPLPRINSLVDVINWCSLETQLPFGLYDADRLDGQVTLRIGLPGETYAGIRKDDVHVGGRLVLSDGRGPFGNPTSDSARTMVTEATASALVVIFAPAEIDATTAVAALALTLDRVRTYCHRES